MLFRSVMDRITYIDKHSIMVYIDKSFSYKQQNDKVIHKELNKINNEIYHDNKNINDINYDNIDDVRIISPKIITVL